MDKNIHGHVTVSIVDTATGKVEQKVETENMVSQTGTFVGLMKMFRCGETLSQNFFGILAGTAPSSAFDVNAARTLTQSCYNNFNIALFDSALPVTQNTLASPTFVYRDKLVWSAEGTDAPTREQATNLLPIFARFKYERVDGKIRLTQVWQRATGTGTIGAICTGSIPNPTYYNNLGYTSNTKCGIINSPTPRFDSMKVIPDYPYNTASRYSALFRFNDTAAGTAHRYCTVNEAGVVSDSVAMTATAISDATMRNNVRDIVSTSTGSAPANPAFVFCTQANTTATDYYDLYFSAATTVLGTNPYPTATAYKRFLRTPADLPADAEDICALTTALVIANSSTSYTNGTYNNGRVIKATHFSPTKGFLHQVFVCESSSSSLHLAVTQATPTHYFWCDYALGTLQARSECTYNTKNGLASNAAVGITRAGAQPTQYAVSVCLQKDTNETSGYKVLQTASSLPAANIVTANITANTTLTAANAADALVVTPMPSVPWVDSRGQWCIIRYNENSYAPKRIRVDDPSIIVTDESAAHQWFSFANLPTPITKPEDKTLIVEYRYEMDLST